MPIPTITMSVGDERAAGKADAGRLALLAFDSLHPNAGAKIDAIGAVLRLVEMRDRRSGDARRARGPALEQHDFLAEPGQHRRRFEPDIAAADHRHAPDRLHSPLIRSTSARRRIM